MTTGIEYFWVPESRVVEMSEEPSSIQTVLPHPIWDPKTGQKIGFVDPKDPLVRPSVFADGDPEHRRPNHNVDVFYEDHVHDWTWVPPKKSASGHVRYYSRAVEHSIWIRCEFRER